MDHCRQNFQALQATGVGVGVPAPILRRAKHPEPAQLPSFLRAPARRQGGFAHIGHPVHIRGFDTASDILSITLPSDVAKPRLALQNDRKTGIATLRADGHVLARIHDAPEDMLLRHVRVVSYAWA